MSETDRERRWREFQAKAAEARRVLEEAAARGDEKAIRILAELDGAPVDVAPVPPPDAPPPPPSHHDTDREPGEDEP